MKNIRYIILFFFFTNVGFAQVKDVSFTVSPFAEYTWWDDHSGLENGTLLGGKLGFSFGEYVELRAVYLQSTDLKTNFDNFGINGFSSDLFNSQDINLTRWGGEFKANIGFGNLNPYVTLGTGVQNIEIDGGTDFEQIYASFGLGIKTKLSDRIVFAVEGKNTQYNFNAGKNLLTEADKITFGVTDADFSSKLLSNWSVQGSLQFYLGGRKPGNLTALDKAYLQKSKGGFKGLRWVAEPSINYIKFDDKSSFRDTWLLGGYVGFDFNAYTGLRVFYLQATTNDEISTDFDDLTMYGLEFRARLNDGNGVTPYLILGGGYLNASSDYLGVNDVSVEGEEFASAGLGLNIPLSKNILITGGARGMVTSSLDVEDLGAPDGLQTHIMYNAGIKLTFGKKSKNPNELYQSQLDDALGTQNKMAQEGFEQKLNSLKEKYQIQLDSLQLELERANQENNVEKAVEVLEQKNKTQNSLDEVENVRKKSSVLTVEPTKEKPAPIQNKELIKMSPAELELLIDKILEETNPSKKLDDDSKEVEQLNKRIDFLEKLILQNRGSSSDESNTKINNDDLTLTQNNELIVKQEELKLQLELISKKIDMLNTAPAEGDKIVVVNPAAAPVSSTHIITKADNVEGITETAVPGRFLKTEKISDEQMTYKGASGFLGLNVGGQTTFNIGARMNYGLRDSKIEFMPELYYGVSKPSSFGLSGNFIYPFKALKYSEFMTPYAGLGAGLIKNDGNLNLSYNIILGTNLKLGKGRVFTDFTTRNFFKYNMFAIGYRFDF